MDVLYSHVVQLPPFLCTSKTWHVGPPGKIFTVIWLLMFEPLGHGFPPPWTPCVIVHCPPW